MPTVTPRVGYAKPLTSDDFDTAEIAANWQLSEDHPGIFICTSSTRPTWGAAHEGMVIFETDRDLYWYWTGAAFVRVWPLGWLDGDERTTDLTDATGSFVVLVQHVVSVPVGGLEIRVDVTWKQVDSTGGAEFAITRDTVSIREWTPADAAGGSYSMRESSPGSGNFTYAFEMRTTGTTTTVTADSVGPATIDVYEV